MSSKLASGVEGNDRAALEALVAQGDTSVPNIEMSDLNDGDILARTRENVNPNGQFQFVYIPDDGTENVTSDWISQEHKKKVTRSWVDGVKSALISRATSKLSEAKEKALEERARRIRDEQFADDQPVGAATDESIKAEAPVGRPTVHGRRASIPVVQPGLSTDPGDYVNDQLELARERLRGAEMAQQDIVREVLSARRDYDKWKALAAALGGVGDDGVREQQQDGNRGDSGSRILRQDGGGDYDHRERSPDTDRAPQREGIVRVGGKAAR